MKSEIKKLNQYMIASASETGLLLLLIIFAILFATNNSIQAYGILIIVFGVLYGVMSITLSILIMATKWESEWCKEQKMLWGILGFLLTFIAILAFTLLGKKHANDIKMPTAHDYYKDFLNEIILED